MVKLFIVEDDSLLVNIYKKMFKTSGYKVEFANDGEEAMSKLKEMEIKPSIIFLDVVISKKGGFEVMREIKEDSKLKDIPVVFLTNMYDPDDEKNGLALGAIFYLLKSKYVPSEIVAKTKEICEKYGIK